MKEEKKIYPPEQSANGVVSMFEESREIFGSKPSLAASWSLSLGAYKINHKTDGAIKKYVFHDNTAIVTTPFCWDIALSPEDDSCMCHYHDEKHSESCQGDTSLQSNKKTIEIAHRVKDSYSEKR